MGTVPSKEATAEAQDDPSCLQKLRGCVHNAADATVTNAGCHDDPQTQTLKQTRKQLQGSGQSPAGSTASSASLARASFASSVSSPGASHGVAKKGAGGSPSSATSHFESDVDGDSTSSWLSASSSSSSSSGGGSSSCSEDSDCESYASADSSDGETGLPPAGSIDGDSSDNNAKARLESVVLTSSDEELTGPQAPSPLSTGMQLRKGLSFGKRSHASSASTSCSPSAERVLSPLSAASTAATPSCSNRLSPQAMASTSSTCPAKVLSPHSEPQRKGLAASHAPHAPHAQPTSPRSLAFKAAEFAAGRLSPPDAVEFAATIIQRGDVECERAAAVKENQLLHGALASLRASSEQHIAAVARRLEDTQRDCARIRLERDRAIQDARGLSLWVARLDAQLSEAQKVTTALRRQRSRLESQSHDIADQYTAERELRVDAQRQVRQLKVALKQARHHADTRSVLAPTQHDLTRSSRPMPAPRSQKLMVL